MHRASRASVRSTWWSPHTVSCTSTPTRWPPSAWDTAVLDEAQAIRNPATRRARAARKLQAAFRVVTTGTPIQNNLVDLYTRSSPFSIRECWVPKSASARTSPLPVGRDGDPAARTRLRRLIAPFVLRRVKADVLDDLPPRTEVTLHVEMSAGGGGAVRGVAATRDGGSRSPCPGARPGGRGRRERGPAASPGAGPSDETAAGVLQSPPGAPGGAAQLQDADLCDHAGRAAQGTPQGPRLLPVRAPPQADRGTPGRGGHPLPVSRRLDPGEGSHRSGSPRSRRARATRF